MTDINFVTIYLAVELFCVALMLMMAYRMNKSIGSVAEVRVFRGLALAACVEIASDCIWAVDCAGGANMPLAVEYVYNMASLVSTGCVAGLWYWFLDLRTAERADLMVRRKLPVFLTCIPLLVLTAACLLSPLNHAIFSVTEDGTYHRGSWYPLHVLCCYCYLFASILHILYSTRQKKLEKATALTFLFSTLSICVGGILQIGRGTVPFTALFYTIGMFFLFVELQSKRINTDALTGLNNRAKARTYLDYRIERAGKEPFCLFMADIDSFKHINDQYGHLSGDEALVIAANTFRSMSRRYNTLFLSRYGGDEFLFLFSVAEGNPVKFQDQFAELLAANLENSSLPFVFRLSFGYTIATTPDTDRDSLIAAADEMLYERKREAHALGVRHTSEGIPTADS